MPTVWCGHSPSWRRARAARCSCRTGGVWLPPPIVDADNDAQRRLIDAGRLVTLVSHPNLVPTTRSIVTLAVPSGRR